jgi:hypothetical protein
MGADTSNGEPNTVEIGIRSRGPQMAWRPVIRKVHMADSCVRFKAADEKRSELVNAA